MTSQTKQTGLIAGGVALVLIVVWWLAVMSPQSHKLSATHKAHAAAQQQITTLQGQVDQLNVLVKQLPADRVALAKLEQAVPDNPALDGAINELQDAADLTGAVVTSLSPSTPVTTGASAPVASTSSKPQSSSSSQSSSVAAQGTTTSASAPVISLSISASGSYQQVMAFITRLDNVSRTFVVTTLNLSGSSERLAAQIIANVFYAGQPTP